MVRSCSNHLRAWLRPDTTYCSSSSSTYQTPYQTRLAELRPDSVNIDDSAHDGPSSFMECLGQRTHSFSGKVAVSLFYASVSAERFVFVSPPSTACDFWLPLCFVRCLSIYLTGSTKTVGIQ